MAIATGSPTMGYLGGANFPADPTDLGPLVPLPGGLEGAPRVPREGRHRAGRVRRLRPERRQPGWRPAESDHRDRAGYLNYARTLRGFLDDNGLEAIGNHGFIPSTWHGTEQPRRHDDDGRLQPPADRARVRAPPSARRSWAPATTRPARTTATSSSGRSPARSGTPLNRISAEWGIQMYTHNHVTRVPLPAGRSARDGDRGPRPAPRSPRRRCVRSRASDSCSTTSTSPTPSSSSSRWTSSGRYVAQHQHRWRYDVNGSGSRTSSIRWPRWRSKRIAYPLYHAKDGDRTAQPVGVGNGYDMIPFGTRAATSTTGRSSRAGGQGFAQPELRAGQRSWRRRRPGAVAALHRDQCRQHERASRLGTGPPRNGATGSGRGRRFVCCATTTRCSADCRCRRGRLRNDPAR